MCAGRGCGVISEVRAETRTERDPEDSYPTTGPEPHSVRWRGRPISPSSPSGSAPKFFHSLILPSSHSLLTQLLNYSFCTVNFTQSRFFLWQTSWVLEAGRPGLSPCSVFMTLVQLLEVPGSQFVHLWNRIVLQRRGRSTKALTVTAGTQFCVN